MAQPNCRDIVLIEYSLNYHYFYLASPHFNLFQVLSKSKSIQGAGNIKYYYDLAEILTS